jgi:fermentation-respiration switch protein FrsA (DUF1100 family)
MILRFILFAGLSMSLSSCIKLDSLMFDGDPASLEDYDFTSELLNGIDPSRITSELIPVGSGRDRLHVIYVERDVAKLDARIDPELEMTVLFSHGNRGNMTKYWGRVGYFEQMGFHVVTYDYRGYGASSGKTTEAHIREDVETVYDYAQSRGARSVLSVGYSMGGVPAIWLCSPQSGREVAGCFTESTFASNDAVMEQAVGYDLPGESLMEPLNNESRIATVLVPFLLMHGTLDNRVSIDSALRLWNAVRDNNALNTFYPVVAGHRNVPVPSYTGHEEPREYSHPSELPENLRADYNLYAERVVAFAAAAARIGGNP